jgi:predicted RNase H-like nuclease (RuvC/YqgF family)
VAEERFPGQFRNLEDKIEELVQARRNLQQTNSELEAKIYYLEEALRTKAAAEHRHVEEKLVIGEKIEGLITTLDQALAK